MPEFIPIETAPDAVQALIAGIGTEPIVFVRDGQPVAELKAPTETPPEEPRPRFGSCRGMLTIVEDDDEHLKDFAEYMY